MFAHNLNLDFELEITSFLSQLLHNHFMLVSKNNNLIKMLIKETLTASLPKELQATKMISNQVVSTITNFFSYRKANLQPVPISELLVGILLRYAIMEQKIVYHLLNDDEKETLINNYIKNLKI